MTTSAKDLRTINFSEKEWLTFKMLYQFCALNWETNGPEQAQMNEDSFKIEHLQ